MASLVYSLTFSPGVGGRGGRRDAHGRDRWEGENRTGESGLAGFSPF